jgi:hypothetical protein
MIILDKSDIDPINRKLYSVEYEGSFYWFRPRYNHTCSWLAVKDDTDNSAYTTYFLEVKGKFTCTCDGYRRAHKCKHTEILKEIKSKYKI